MENESVECEKATSLTWPLYQYGIILCEKIGNIFLVLNENVENKVEQKETISNNNDDDELKRKKFVHGAYKR